MLRRGLVVFALLLLACGIYLGIGVAESRRTSHGLVFVEFTPTYSANPTILNGAVVR